MLQILYFFGYIISENFNCLILIGTVYPESSLVGSSGGEKVELDLKSRKSKVKPEAKSHNKPTLTCHYAAGKK